jgi:hypothetical protein
MGLNADENAVLNIEGHPYPSVLMGEDAFTGWFGKGRFPSESERAKRYCETLHAAYDYGVRGFAMSPHPALCSILANFKERHPDAVCVANPHWGSHYNLGKESLWAEKNLRRMLATVACKLEPEDAARKPGGVFAGVDTRDCFGDMDFRRIILDPVEYARDIQAFRGFCDFCVVGNLPFGFLHFAGRMDIVEAEISFVRSTGMVPIGICEGGRRVLDAVRKLDVAGFWVWQNRTEVFPAMEGLGEALSHDRRPATAYRIFDHPTGFDLSASLGYVKSNMAISALLIGVGSLEHAHLTFPAIDGFRGRK